MKKQLHEYNNGNVRILVKSRSIKYLEKINKYTILKETEGNDFYDTTISILQNMQLRSVINKIRANNRINRHIETYKDVYHDEYICKNGIKIYITSNNTDQYIIYRFKNSVFIHFSNENTGKTISLRILRECLYRLEITKGAASFHAAAVSDCDNNAYLIVGPSGCGKTTLLSLLLIDSNWSFITNDRSLIRKNNKSISCLPVPTRYGYSFLFMHHIIKERITRMLPMLDRVNTSTISYQIDDSDKWKLGSSVKIQLSPLETKNLLHCKEIVNNSNLKTILIPKASSTADRLHIEHIENNEAKKILKGEIRSPNDEVWINPWVQEQRFYEEEDVFIDKLIKSVPSYRVHFPLNWNLNFSSMVRQTLLKL